MKYRDNSVCLCERGKTSEINSAFENRRGLSLVEEEDYPNKRVTVKAILAFGELRYLFFF